MSFSSQKIIYYLVNQFHYYLLMRSIKMITMLKHQQLKDSESDETESSKSKFQQLDVDDNKEGQALDKYQDKYEDKICV